MGAGGPRALSAGTHQLPGGGIQRVGGVPEGQAGFGVAGHQHGVPVPAEGGRRGAVRLGAAQHGLAADGGRAGDVGHRLGGGHCGTGGEGKESSVPPRAGHAAALTSPARPKPAFHGETPSGGEPPVWGAPGRASPRCPQHQRPLKPPRGARWPPLGAVPQLVTHPPGLKGGAQSSLNLPNRGGQIQCPPPAGSLRVAAGTGRGWQGALRDRQSSRMGGVGGPAAHLGR